MASGSNDTPRGRNGLWRRLYLFSSKPHMEWGDTEINISAEQEKELRASYETEKSKSLTVTDKARDLQTLRKKFDKNLESAREEAQSSHLMTSPLLRQPRKPGDEGGQFSNTNAEGIAHNLPPPGYMDTDPGIEVKPLDDDSVGRIVGDASFLYAEGDDVTAESLLLRGIEEFPQESRELYLYLLDLYHATGQRGQFDATSELFALTFKERTPRWSDETAGTPNISRRDSMTMEPTLNEAQAIDLFGYIEARMHQQRDITIDFSKLRDVTPNAMPVLGTAINMMNDMLTDVFLLGIERLRRILTDMQATCGESQPYWLARLAVERLRNDMNSFIAVARDASHGAGLDGNAWAMPRCTVRAPLDLGSGLSLMALDETVTKDTRANSRDEGYVNAIGLSGQMKGDEVERSISMRASSLTLLPQVVVECKHLKRLDFEGGVTLLNWISQWEGQTKTVKLVNINRMVLGLLRRLGASPATSLMLHTLY